MAAAALAAAMPPELCLLQVHLKMSLQHTLQTSDISTLLTETVEHSLVLPLAGIYNTVPVAYRMSAPVLPLAGIYNTVPAVFRTSDYGVEWS